MSRPAHGDKGIMKNEKDEDCFSCHWVSGDDIKKARRKPQGN